MARARSRSLARPLSRPLAWPLSRTLHRARPRALAGTLPRLLSWPPAPLLSLARALAITRAGAVDVAPPRAVGTGTLRPVAFGRRTRARTVVAGPRTWRSLMPRPRAWRQHVGRPVHARTLVVAGAVWADVAGAVGRVVAQPVRHARTVVVVVGVDAGAVDDGPGMTGHRLAGVVPAALVHVAIRGASTQCDCQGKSGQRAHFHGHIPWSGHGPSLAWRIEHLLNPTATPLKRSGAGQPARVAGRANPLRYSWRMSLDPAHALAHARCGLRAWLRPGRAGPVVDSPREGAAWRG